MLKKGQVLNNRYQIQAILGEGGFGAVYKVWDDNLQRHCAIKENLQVSAESQNQFKREAIMLANLNHPHLVRVTDYFFISNQGQYLVMDYVEGNDLDTILINNGGPLHGEQALAWIKQVCDALIYIHNQNPPIIHRDIKPANIRINPQGNAVLVDFGLAKAFDISTKTSLGARGLTPNFAAPEQYGTGGTDAQSDIYSLGVTLYCLLTYRVPPDSVEIMVGNANPPAPAKAINQNIPDSISDVLQRAMQIRRTDRYKSVSDFKNALEEKQKFPAQAKAAPVGTASNSYQEFMVETHNGKKLRAEELVGTAIQFMYRNGDIPNVNYQVTNENLGTIVHVIKSRGFKVVIVDVPANDKSLPAEIKTPQVSGQNQPNALSTPAQAKAAPAGTTSSKPAISNAMELIEKTLEINSRDVKALNDKANSLQELGRYEEAIRYYDKALEIDPRHVDSLNNKGISLDRLGRYEEALRCFEQALTINGDLENLNGMAVSLFNMMTVYARQGELFIALPLAQQAAQLWNLIDDPMKKNAQEVIAQIKDVITFPLDEIIEKIQKVTSPAELQTVFTEYPIMMNPDVLDIFSKDIPDAVPPHARPAYRQHLEWIIPVVNNMAQSAHEVFFHQVHSLAKLHIAVKQYPFMIHDRFIQVAEQVINEQISSQEKHPLGQLLNWLKQIASQG